MGDALLSLLDERLRTGLRFHEWKDGALHGQTASSLLDDQSLPSSGNYLIARAPGVPELWSAIRFSLRKKKTLVILPPATPLEEALLFRQLPATAPDQAVVAFFTSGTTGEPKAVFHSERSLLASARQLERAFPGHTATASLLPAWGMGGAAFHFLLPLLRRGDLFFCREPFLNWAPSAAKIFFSLEIGLLSLNPFLLEMLLRAGVEPRWGGRVVSLTAPLKQPLSASFALASGTPPLEIYGMTEAAGPVLLEGQSLGAEVRISPSHELEIRGPQLFLGYSTRGNFEPAPDWFPTGDIFTLENGRYLHQARERELIDSGGRKIAPCLIEMAFAEMPELEDSLAFSIELGGVERPGLIYVRQKSCVLSQAELAQAVESQAKKALSVELRPFWWQEVEAIPRLANGKPDRKKAKNQWADRGQLPQGHTSSS